jgi:hypothetical protein
MSHELFYTSAPRGLVKGVRGYCAVAMTTGLPHFLAERLEDLSGYKPLYAALDARNPINWSHVRLELGRQIYHVLSRVGAAGLDYSDRNNKFAHHVILLPEELPPGGPAWLMQQPGFLETRWEGEPRWLPSAREVPQGNLSARPCKAWEKVTGDAGWAGVLAETLLTPPPRPALLVCDAKIDVLSLFAEALALLPPRLRWTVTFSTYASSLPSAESCLWRGLVQESDGKEAHGSHTTLVLFLGKPLGPAKGGVLVEAARSGKAMDVSALPATAQRLASVPGPKTTQLAAAATDEVNGLGQVSLASLAPSAKKKPAPTEGALIGNLSEEPSLFESRYVCFGLGALVALCLLFVGELVTQGALADLVRDNSRTSLIAETVDKTKKIEFLEKNKTDLERENAEKIASLKTQRSHLDSMRVAAHNQKEKLEGEIKRLAEKVSADAATAERIGEKAALLGESLAKMLHEVRKVLETTGRKPKPDDRLADLEAKVQHRAHEISRAGPAPMQINVAFESLECLALQPRTTDEKGGTFLSKYDSETKSLVISLVEGSREPSLVVQAKASKEGKEGLQLSFRFTPSTKLDSSVAVQEASNLYRLEDYWFLLVQPKKNGDKIYIRLKRPRPG